ncbi:MAG TPA: FAD-linked oxidase C-terminal domain-containing protein, partial [Thermomicrobiales bacterium]|nr:FAD-linked oxidase C-terminal domain-containing protein [Thermomicrobiales bacterium]
DASNYRQPPIGVVIPRDTDDIVRTVALCRQYDAPLLPRGGGTSLAGQCCNVAVVLDCSKYLRGIVSLDPQQKRARVQPGIVLDDLRNAAERHHLTFGPDPATHDHCTLGGMLGNNSCGVHSIMAGKTSDNVESLDILTYDGLRLRVGATSDEELAQIIAAGGRRGEIYGRLKALRDKYGDLVRERFPDIPRRVSGYGLEWLLPEHGFHVARALVGTEGTCVTILEATLQLVDSPPKRTLVVLGYPDIYRACDHIPEILAHHPVGLEGFDDHLVAAMKKKHLHPADVALLPPGNGWLLVEFGAATQDEADNQARGMMDALKQAGDEPQLKLFNDPAEEGRIWAVRESALGASAAVPGEDETWPGWEDSAVPPDRMGDYLRDLAELLQRYHYTWAFYGHFGQGCLHMRANFNFGTRDGIAHFRAFLDEATDLIVRYGGSVSGEHGDGQARAALLPKMFGDELMVAFREFKAIWDPGNKMNPGKVIDAYGPDENLRLGTDYRPPQTRTHFSFFEDNGSFAQATRRCVGVGKCRREGGGTMCPSYMVTHEEEHSTRGRARLLFEMLEGDPLDEGWRSEAVREALDLCLACKGCKGDCPVNVDMATYKSEFLAHYYAGRRRPIAAYTMGLINYWAQLASRAPGLANAVTQTPLLRTLVKAVGGIAPARTIPAFAAEPFTTWFRRRTPPATGERVILWPDTFNNYFHPATAQAAVEALEAGGYRVEIPQVALCCGRPLYDWGMLDLARRQLRQILTALRPAIAAGVPVVGLEPSCVAVFRDELLNLFPHDEDAKRLSQQTFLLSEFLVNQASDYPWPHLDRKAIIHGHCHHKAVLDFDAEEEALKRLGLDCTVLDAGCCGMAGAFGFERGDKYDVSIKAGERVLLPAVRAAPPDAFIVADGFSCREQIEQTTDRRALHLAQVIALARQGAPASGPPEDACPAPRTPNHLPLALAGAGALIVGALAWWQARQR